MTFYLFGCILLSKENMSTPAKAYFDGLKEKMKNQKDSAYSERSDLTFKRFIEGMDKIRRDTELIHSIKKEPNDEDVSTSYPSTWPKPTKSTAMDKIFREIFEDEPPKVIDSVLMTDEEKEQAKSKRKPNVVNISFDVFIGNPVRARFNPHQKVFMMNSQGKSLYFSHHRDVIQNSIELFNNNIKAAHHNGLPRFTIYSGDNAMAPMAAVELIFYGLTFDDTKIKASFIYYNEPLMANSDVRNLLNEVDQTCHFFILGEFELDETEENITGMEIESLDYVNPYRTDNHEPLHRV